MAKSWLAGLLAHYQGNTTKLALFYRVERVDGDTFGFNDSDTNITIDGLIYYASEGLSLSTVQNSDGFNVASLDATVFLNVSTEAELEAGIWEEATVTVFEARWDSPPATLASNAVNFLRHGVLGRLDRQNLRFTAEIRDLKTRLESRIGYTFAATCPWRHARWNGTTFVADAACGVVLTSHIHTGTVTSVGSDPRMIFSASAQAEVAGYYNEGIIAFTSGPNAGLGKLSSMDIRRWEGQQFTLHRPLPYAVAVGNTFIAVRGDDKRFETCQDVYDNVGQFRGFNRLPGIDKLLESPLLHVPLAPRPAPPDNNPAYNAAIIGNDSSND